MKDELLISYLLNETTADETKLVSGWLAADTNNQRYFDQFKAVWDASKAMTLTVDVDARASLTRFKALAKASNRKPVAIKHLWLNVAAVLTLVGIGVWLLVQQTNTTTQLTLSTNQTEVKSDTLADGSIITLNKNTTFLHPDKFVGSTRAVALETGEAFFKISPDKKKPFIISVNGAAVKVVGTSFNIKAAKNVTEVIVETGVVEVTRAGKTVTLHPGEKTVISQNAADFNKQQTPDLLYQYYRTKKFVADDTPLWRMVEVLNEAYDSRIVIGNKTIANLPLNTTFDNESLDDILNVIVKTFHITAIKRGEQIILK